MKKQLIIILLATSAIFGIFTSGYAQIYPTLKYTIKNNTTASLSLIGANFECADIKDGTGTGGVATTINPGESADVSVIYNHTNSNYTYFSGSSECTGKDYSTSVGTSNYGKYHASGTFGYQFSSGSGSGSCKLGFNSNAVTDPTLVGLYTDPTKYITSGNAYCEVDPTTADPHITLTISGPR